MDLIITILNLLVGNWCWIWLRRRTVLQRFFLALIEEIEIFMNEKIKVVAEHTNEKWCCCCCDLIFGLCPTSLCFVTTTFQGMALPSSSGET
jgi:hypothetical protein